jgi:hypothetical protein
MGIKTSGLDLLRADLAKLADAVGGDLPEKMLDAGAEAAVQDWKEGITAHKHVDTGDMLNSVGVAPETRSGKKREIYPLGTDRKGVRNAEKAYVINYGRSKGSSKRKKWKGWKGSMGKGANSGIQGDRFVGKIQKNAETSTYKAMARVFDEETQKIIK